VKQVSSSQKVRREFEQKVAKLTKGSERIFTGLSSSAGYERSPVAASNASLTSGSSACSPIHRRVRREFEQKVAKLTKGSERIFTGLSPGGGHERSSVDRWRLLMLR